jgi:hypothetical protein
MLQYHLRDLQGLPGKNWGDCSAGNDCDFVLCVVRGFLNIFYISGRITIPDPGKTIYFTLLPSLI